MKKFINISTLFAIGLFTLSTVYTEVPSTTVETTLHDDSIPKSHPRIKRENISAPKWTSDELMNEDEDLLDSIEKTTKEEPAQSGPSGSESDSLARDLSDRLAREKINTTGTSTSTQKDNKKQSHGTRRDARKTRRGARKDARHERRMHRQGDRQENRQKRMNKRMDRRKVNTEIRKENIEWRQNLRTAAQDGNFDKVKELIKGHDRGSKEFKENMLKAAEAKDKAKLLKLIEQRERKLKMARERAKDKRTEKKEMKKNNK